MGKFAENTTVPADRSRAEIERILVKYGAAGFMYGWERSNAIIAFAAQGRHIRFILPMPDKNSKEIRTDPRRSWAERPESQQEKIYEQQVRQKWRALALAVKAKLECVESGITSFEDEFLAHIVLPDGQTVGTAIREKISQAYSDGKMPMLLGAAE